MKKGFIIAGSFLLVCLVVLAIIFAGGNDKKDNLQDPTKEESDTGLEVIDPEQMEEEEEEKVFIAPNKADDKASEDKDSTGQENNNKREENPQDSENGDKNENEDNTENDENSDTPKGDLNENEEDDGKTQMGEFF